MTSQTISILLLIIKNTSSKKPAVLMLAVENAEKTHFVQNLCGNSDALVMPTMDCAHQYYSRFLIKNLSGQESYRHCSTADCFIFVINLLDVHDRIDEAKQRLIGASAKTRTKTFMIVMNKRTSSSYNGAARKKMSSLTLSFGCNA